MKNQNGFGAVGIVVALLVTMAVGGAGFFVYQKSGATQEKVTENKQTNSASATPSQPSQTLPETIKKYSNEKYGVAFEYPKEWMVNEIPNDNPTGPQPVEFGIAIDFNIDEKYKTAVVFEVYSKDFQSMKAAKIANSEQSPSAQITKTESMKFGRQSIHIVSIYPNTKPNPSKGELYLYAVGDKTYSLRSINDELNVQREPNYWNYFNAIHDSLQIK